MSERFAQFAEVPVETAVNQQLVGFIIGDELFGVDILSVQEIIRDVAITAIPDSPAFLEGVINLRGNIIPVIDLRKRLKLMAQPKPEDQSLWIIILTVEGRVTGFVVDRVTKVLNVPVSSIKPPPDIVVSGLKRQYIGGVCKLEERLLILLDFERVLMADEIKKLKSMKRPKIMH
ncbi:Chemotaxis protein CheW [Desulfosarcina cetonica]|uniref:chemotaxis protein CheW n=1 Tax=Desulfosarcina cetonica TaxID=90730 RepID=UPI0006CF9442|nr:chemotaxis protein CheW [Desulfosarcina cetonica]VTR65539.1 Chemotaxis protein CheW [Desulfosarcina cetonica]